MKIKRRKITGFYLPILMIFLITFSLKTIAQTTNHIDANGLKQGKWIKTYSNGATRYEGNFVDGKPEGTFTYYFPSGSVKAVSNYYNGGKIAYTKTFQLNGKPLAEGKYVAQKRDSTWRFYSDLDGKLVSEIGYKNGIKEGKSIIYFPDFGIPSQVTEFHNGLKNGELMKYFTDGKPSTLETFVNDTLDGPFKIWYPEGGIQMEGFYKEGYQDGLWTTYDEKGKVIKKERFAKGLPVQIKKR